MSRTTLFASMTVLLASLLLANTAIAGGGEEPRQQQPRTTAPAKAPSSGAVAARDKALDQARQAAPTLPSPSVAATPRAVSSPATVPTQIMTPPPTPPRPQGSAATATADWLLDNGQGRCTPLDQAPTQAATVGRFDNPQDFARKMVQHGHQSFLLNIAADQVRVKVPDLDLNLLFVKPGLCRN